MGTSYMTKSNTSFQNKVENIQYNANLAVTGAIRGTSKERLYKELGNEFLQQRRWCRKLATFLNLL